MAQTKTRKAVAKVKQAVADIDWEHPMENVIGHGNLNDVERTVSMVAGGLLGGMAAARITRVSGWVMAGVAVGLLARGVTGTCGLYSALGINHRK